MIKNIYLIYDYEAYKCRISEKGAITNVYSFFNGALTILSLESSING